MGTPAHHKRPDPSEPWRYACPDCSSTTIRTNLGKGGTPPGKKYPFYGSIGVNQAKADRGKIWYCRKCQERKSCLIDRRDGTMVEHVTPSGKRPTQEVIEGP